MFFLKNYYNKIILYDLINKFNYNCVKDIPKPKTILLNINCKYFKNNDLMAIIVLFQLILKKKSFVLKTHNFIKTNLRIKKGFVISCKLILKKDSLYFFLEKLLIDILSTQKRIKTFFIHKKTINNLQSFSFNLKEILNIYELEQYYFYFKNITTLRITIVTKQCLQKDFIFLLKSFKLNITS